MKASPLPSVVFVDRDGVLCEDNVEPVGTWDRFRWLPGAREALRDLARANVPVVVITNQAGVGRGIVTREQVEEVHRRLRSEVELAGGRLDGVYACYHAPEEECDCRKPLPGLIVQAVQDLRLDLRAAWMIGDSRRDVEAGRAAGCRTVLVLTGKGNEESRKFEGADEVVEDLGSAVRLLLAGRTGEE